VSWICEILVWCVVEIFFQPLHLYLELVRSDNNLWTLYIESQCIVNIHVMQQSCVVLCVIMFLLKKIMVSE